jgi:TolB-like protein
MPTDRLIRFADFELDVERYQLRRAGQQIRLERLPMDLLILLASRHGELLARADIVDRLWGGSPFRDTENGINTAIRKIRIALEEDPANPHHLVTVKGKGYRLDGMREALPETAGAMPAPQEGALAPMRALVLPFANLTGDAAQESLCSALADEISATLGALDPERLLMIARTTAARYRGLQKSIGEIARELKVDYVLEGSLTQETSQEASRLRILTRLIRCADEVQIWSRAHEPMAQGALDILKEVAAALAKDLTPTLGTNRDTARGTALARRLPVDPAAHDAYVRGRFFWYRRVHFDAGFSAHHAIDGEDFFRSRTYFETALERDPAYALGYTGLSNYYGSTVVHGIFAPEEGWPVARGLAENALELDPDLPEAHHALAAVRYFFEWDWSRAEAGFKEALRLNPSYPEAHRLYARLLAACGRRAESDAAAGRAERIDPLAFQGSRAFGMVLSGKHEQVVSEYPPLVYQLLAIAFEVKKLYPQAVDATLEALVRCGQHTRAAAIRAQWQAGGYDAVLHWHLDDLLARQRSRYTSPLLIAETYARLGEADAMFHWLEAALAERSSRLCELRTNPWFQPWRGTGRMRTVEKHIGAGQA